MKVRLVLFVIGLTLWATGVAYRLYQLQIERHADYAERALGQQKRVVDIEPPRGTIFDAKGRTLALSLAVDSACVFPQLLEDPQTAAAKIGRVLGRKPATIVRNVSQARQFAWVERQLEPEKVEALRALEIEGLGFFKESKRYYPMQSLAGPVLGFVGTDHSGLGGLEAQYESTVAGRAVRRTMIQDGSRGRMPAPGLTLRDAEPGADIHLTLDASIQHIVERELERAVRERRAKSGTAVLLDPKSGAVLAMASAPSFDPNRFSSFPPSHRQNLAIQFNFEPGSTFKLVTAAAALERNLIDPVDVIDCERGSITLERTRIRDHKSFDLLTFRDVFAKSSNVGAIKLGLKVGKQGLFEQLEAFGFGQPTGIDLQGEEKGLVVSPEKWHRHFHAYASIGQGISVTALQLANAFAAVANGGELPKPYIVRAVGGRDEIPSRSLDRPRVASPSTVRTLVRLLEAVVEEGTGTAAAIPGYRVAGKTGTAQKAVTGRGYIDEKHIASFAGFVPSRDPRVVAVIVIDEPRGELFHGGEVAAPVFSSILGQVLPYLGVAPEEQLLQPPAAAEPPWRPRLAERKSAEELAAGAAKAGRMPDLSGLDARQAVWVASALGLETKVNGSGRVAVQAPPAGVPLERAGEELLVWLSAGI